MKNTILLATLVFLITGCDNTADATANQQAKKSDMYRVPPPSDPAEDKWAKPGTTNQKLKGQ